MNRTLYLAALVSALLSLSLSSPALAQTIPAQTTPAQTAPAQSALALTPQAALTRLAQAPKLDPRWFVPAFARSLPQVQGGFQGFAAQYGAFQGVDALGQDTYRLRYAGGAVTVTAQLNAAGQFSGLFLKSQQASAAVTPPAPTTPALTTAAPTTTAALDRLFRAPAPQAEWFSPEFLQAAPIASLTSTFSLLRQGLSAFQGVSEDGKTLRFAQGRIPVNRVGVDAQGRFTSLFVGTPVRSAGAPRPSLQSAVDAFKALPGQVSVAVMDYTAGESGKRLGGLNPEAKLAVGSSFKLGVLAQLQSGIKAGQHAWAEVATLQAADRALPSGILQSWPDASPLTLASLATLMISVSDNTATNVLLRLLGRDGVGQKLDLGAVPSTRDLFALKNPANKALQDAYLSGDDTQKKAVLAQVAAAPLPPASLFDNGAVVAPGVEWFVSATRLCNVMNEVAALPLMGINPGVADPAQFRTVSYKGGSEGGVLNFTTQVTTLSGRSVCLSATWNNAAPLDQTRFGVLYSALLQALQ